MGAASAILVLALAAPASADAQTAAPGWWDTLTIAQRQALVNGWTGFQGVNYQPYMDAYPRNAAQAVRSAITQLGSQTTGAAGNRLAVTEYALLREIGAIEGRPTLQPQRMSLLSNPTRLHLHGLTRVSVNIAVGVLGAQFFMGAVAELVLPVNGWDQLNGYWQTEGLELVALQATDGRNWRCLNSHMCTGDPVTDEDNHNLERDYYGGLLPLPNYSDPETDDTLIDGYYAIRALQAPSTEGQQLPSAWVNSGAFPRPCGTPYGWYMPLWNAADQGLMGAHVSPLFWQEPNMLMGCWWGTEYYPAIQVGAVLKADPGVELQPLQLRPPFRSDSPLGAPTAEADPADGRGWQLYRPATAQQLLDVEQAIREAYESEAGEPLRAMAQQVFNQAVMVPMVDCRGMVIAVCENRLVAEGLQVGNVVVWDDAGANLQWGANEITWTDPWPPEFTPQVEIGTRVDIWVNPQVMPVEVPEPLPGEHYQAYVQRLQELGLVGRTEVDPSADPALDPGTVTSVAPEPYTQVQTGTEVLVRHREATGTRTLMSVRPCNGCEGTPWGPAIPSLNFEPLRIEGLCTNFPFGLPCWTYNIIGAFVGAQTPPDWVLPIGRSSGCGGCGVRIDFGDFEPAMAIARPVTLVLGTVGIVWAFGALVTGRSILGRSRGGGED